MFLIEHIRSRHALRVVMLNVAGLMALVIGILHVSQFRNSLIEERTQSLEIHGHLIANAIAASVTDSHSSWYEPDRPLLRPIAPLNSHDDTPSIYKFSLNPKRTGAILTQIKPTNIRARIYDTTGSLVIDSNELFTLGGISLLDPLSSTTEQPGVFNRTWRAVKTAFNRDDPPLYQELGPNSGKNYPEVARVLDGAPTANMVRVGEREEVIVSVAVPIKSMQAVQATLLLTSHGGDIN